MKFKSRVDGARQLAARLTAYGNRSDVLVLGLPRGGVPVAAEVARQLGAPLDVFLVRKLGVPGHAELAMGAIAEGGIKVLHNRLIAELRIPAALVEQTASRERDEPDDASIGAKHANLETHGGKKFITVDDRWELLQRPKRYSPTQIRPINRRMSAEGNRNSDLGGVPGWR